MADWLRRVAKLFSQDAPAAPVTSTLAPASVPATAPAAVLATQASPLPDLDAELFGWLLDFPPGPDRPADATESAWLAALDPMIVADKGRGELLPRAAGLIPQLLNGLRDNSQSSAELAQRVARDANLVAEVTRLANSPAYRGTEPVSELADAIRHVGTTGVRQAISKVVLKPMFDAHGGGLSARAAGRLWLHSQAQADLCRAIALECGIDPFEAYLGGLLGGVGWTAGLRALDRVFEQHPPASAPVFSSGFQSGFRQRRDRLFAQFLTGWRLSPALHEAARDVQYAGSFVAASDPLAQLLLAGDRLASLRMGVRGDADAATLLAAFPRSVRSAYEALGKTG